MTLFFISPGMIITSFYWEFVEQIVHRLLCPLPCYQAIACTLVSLLQQLMLQPQTVVSLFSTTPGMIILHSTWSCLCTEVTWPSFVRASPSEFVIPLAKYVKAVYHTRVSVGMRFRMLFETEESSVRRWVETCKVYTAWKLCVSSQHENYVCLMAASSFRYMGTITGISDLDSERWPNSHWRSVKVNSLKLLYGCDLQSNCRYLI